MKPEEPVTAKPDVVEWSLLGLIVVSAAMLVAGVFGWLPDDGAGGIGFRFQVRIEAREVEP